jgi:HD superfamily phosphodiesterase
MKNTEIIKEALNFVKEKLANETSGHDFWHAYRV